jgi:hypothetical protein
MHQDICEIPTLTYSVWVCNSIAWRAPSRTRVRPPLRPSRNIVSKCFAGSEPRNRYVRRTATTHAAKKIIVATTIM